MSCSHSRGCFSYISEFQQIQKEQPLQLPPKPPQKRKWRGNTVAPFGANNMLVLYSCPANTSSKYFVQVLHNEHPIPMPVSPRCLLILWTLYDFEEIWIPTSVSFLYLMRIAISINFIICCRWYSFHPLWWAVSIIMVTTDFFLVLNSHTILFFCFCV